MLGSRDDDGCDVKVVRATRSCTAGTASFAATPRERVFARVAVAIRITFVYEARLVLQCSRKRRQRRRRVRLVEMLQDGVGGDELLIAQSATWLLKKKQKI